MEYGEHKTGKREKIMQKSTAPVKSIVIRTRGKAGNPEYANMLDTAASMRTSGQVTIFTCDTLDERKDEARKLSIALVKYNKSHADAPLHLGHVDGQALTITLS